MLICQLVKWDFWLCHFRVAKGKHRAHSNNINGISQPPPTSATFQSYTKLGSVFRVSVMEWVRSCVYSCKLRWKFATHYFHMSVIGNESAAIFCTIFGFSCFVCSGFYAKLLFCLSAWTVYCMRQSVGCVLGVCLCVCVWCGCVGIYNNSSEVHIHPIGRMGEVGWVCNLIHSCNSLWLHNHQVPKPFYIVNTH